MMAFFGTTRLGHRATRCKWLETPKPSDKSRQHNIGESTPLRLNLEGAERRWAFFSAQLASEYRRVSTSASGTLQK
jgi:hypothetical protein